jgi:hypothetical protein
MNTTERSDQLILAEVQVLLAQMRTQLSILRAGMALIAGSLTISFLLLTNHWVLEGEWAWADWPVKLVLGAAAIIGLWRLGSAEQKIRKIHRLIRDVEHKNKLVDEIMV